MVWGYVGRFIMVSNDSGGGIKFGAMVKEASWPASMME